MKHLTKGLMAMFLGITAISCVSNTDYGEVDKSEDYKKNAEKKLGITIPANQDFTMVSTATVATTVNLEEGETYTVRVYANDPIQEGVGKYIATGSVQNGHTFTTNVTYPSAKKTLYVGATDSKGFTTYKQVEIVNAQAIANITTKNTTAASRGTRSITVGKDTYDKFPSAADVAANFPTAIPGDAVEVSELLDKYKGKTWGTATLWDIYAIYANVIKEGFNLKITQAGTTELGGTYQNAGWDASAGKNIAYPYNVYVNVDGNVTLKRSGATHFNLYILKGNVTLESNYGEQAGIISVAAGATLNDQRNSIAANQGVKIFNRGTINATNASKYDIGNSCTVYNESKFNVTGALTYSPGDANTSYFMNLGDNAELTAAAMTLNSAGNFFNSGTVNITGETSVTQKEIYWVNNGHYTTGSMKFSAWNTTFFNYCQLTVVNNCAFQDGQFNMMENSYAEFGTANFNNFQVNMENHAAFYVKGVNSWGAQGDGIYQGFKAAAGAEAYVKLSGKTTIASHKNSMVISEGINLAHGEIDDLGKSNIGVQPTHVFNGTEVSDANLTITKSAEGCGATITTGGRIDPVEPEVYTYAFEDTDDGDYDLNDVVLRVNEKPGDATKLIVTLVATGADYNIETYINNQVLTFNGETEVHKALLGEEGVMKHINTESTVGGRYAKADFVTCEIAKPADFNNDYSTLKVSIKVLNTEKTYAYPHTNTYPNAVMMPGKWKWPKEKVCITTAYSVGYETLEDHSFSTWASEYPHVNALDWYDNPVTNQVVNMDK